MMFESTISRTVIASCVIGVLGLVGGCQESAPPTTRSAAPVTQPSNTETPTAAAKDPKTDDGTVVSIAPESTDSQKPNATPAVSLDIKNWEETLALVAEHKGKVVVLDLWSTSCDPCVKEFPHLVELHKKQEGKVACMSGSCDYVGLKNKPPESYKPQVLEFLTKQEATFQNILFNVESDALFEKIELASIPAVYVFGKDGKLAKRFDNDAGGAEFTYEKEILPFVEALLAK